MTLRLFVLAALLASGCMPGPAPLTAESAREQIITVPVTGLDGATDPILVRVCRPDTDAPARLVVINHGSPAVAADRIKEQPARCGSEAVQWFLRRGMVAAMPLRRGYGATGGAYPEAVGPCARADYIHAGRESARDIDAAVNALTALPGVLPDHAIVVGQLAGGWATIAYGSGPHPRVSALVVMAGGRGGHLDNVPGRNCRPELLAAAAGQFGRTSATPELWIYTANDSFFAPEIATALHDAFTASGGRAELVQPGPFGRDGHALFFGRGGSAVWGPVVERYLRSRD